LEAIVLADEARAFFDQQGESHKAELNRHSRLDYACESLKVSTRIMHSIAWLLVQRAVLCGELAESARLEERHQLGEAQDSDPKLRATMPAEMEGLILVSEDLYHRVARLEEQLIERATRGTGGQISPVRDMLARLETTL
jgi:regulator of CtrA degradation